LIVNAGSSSLKWVVLDAATEAIEQQGDASWEGTEGGRHEEAMADALSRVTEVDAIGHRVVHGGQHFKQAVLIDDAVRQGIVALAELAPLHNPAAVAGIDVASQRLPGIPQVASFDTAFHSTLSEPAAIYPLPTDWSARWGLRRFGFHGLSVAYATGRAEQLLGHLPGRMVVCHLGAGCSITAVAQGRSVDTSMGFTPLEGVMMARRSGSVDPGLLLYLLNRQSMDPAVLEKGLNEDSGLLGVSGVSADMRQVLAAADTGNTRARLARDVFVHRLVSSVGAMAATLRGLDALVFTGGIGEHSAAIRALACEAFGYLGLRLDERLNQSANTDRDIASAESATRVLVIAAREDLSILRDVNRVLGWTSV
jgi:acetate kinase